MSYTFDTNDAIGLAHAMGADYKTLGNEMTWKLCPYCQGGMHHDEGTFSINLEGGMYNCFRSSCGAKGHFAELARDFDYPIEVQRPTIYKILPQRAEPVKSTDRAIEYMESRGISAEITKRYEITTDKKHPDTIVFPFYDETGKLQYIKYRDSKYYKGKPGLPGKEWAMQGTMPILFGMKQCKDFSQLIITEGQIDSLSVAQAGFPNVVSVPTGAKGFTWYVVCKDWIEKFQDIVIFGDNEHGHITLVDELKARLPQTVKVVRQKDYLGEKDANDILRTYGTAAIQKAIANAQPPTIENTKDLAAVTPVDINGLYHLETGFGELDRLLSGGMYVGQVVLVTGKRGEGKSTFVTQITNNVLEQGETVFIYSGELADFNVKYWLDLQLAGAEHLEYTVNKWGDKVFHIAPDVQEKINNWYRGRCYLYDNDYVFKSEANELECLVDTIEKVIKQYGARFITIDNLMTAMEVVTNQDNLYLAQSNFVGSLKKIAVKYKVVIILVAHPRKSQGGFSNDDVSGSSDITNKVDIVMNYSRDTQDADHSYLMVTKNRMFGKLRTKENALRMVYSPESKRIIGMGDSVKHYGWENPPQLKEEFIPVEPEELPF